MSGHSGVAFVSATARYPGSDAPAVEEAAFTIDEGDLVLVTGESGSGKSTLLRLINGLVPHSSGGRLSGDVVTFGRSVRTHRPRDLADLVGFVHQDPEAQMVVDRVEDDIAFVLENLGEAPAAMRRRVEEVLDALGIAHLRGRIPATLSGGERQRVAIAGAIAPGPRCLVLDEPTSQLDPQGADDVLAAVARLNDDLGTTVLLAEHRLDRAAPLAHRALVMSGARVAADGPVGTVLAGYAGAPAVTRLGLVLGWTPPPLTVRDARRLARTIDLPPRVPAPSGAAPGDVLVSACDLGLAHGRTRVLRDVGMEIAAGEVVALMGRNGSGKTTLLRSLAGLHRIGSGALERRERVAYVPQDPGAMLSAPTVRAEVEATVRLLGRRDAGSVDAVLRRFALTDLADRHPRTLSGGQRQRVAVAAVAVGGAPVLLLDEPTRGLDAPSRDALEHAVSDHAAAGGAVVVATHDVELAARIATRVIVLGDGEVVASGPAREVLAGSLFAPQVLRVVPPYLTVAEVAEAVAS